MTDSHVDGAAILGALEALDSRSPEATPIWAYRSLVEVTSVLLLVPRVVLSPIPELHAAAIGPYGRILAELAPLIDQRPAPVEARQRSLRTTQRWAREHPGRLRDCLFTYQTEDSYHHWIDWLARNQWPDHARRHGGLFEKAFVPQIAKVLDVSSQELHDIRAATVTSSDLARIVAKPDEEKSLLVRDAFTLSTLLRGRYYEYLSRRTQCHVLHHVMRTPILGALPPSRRTSAPVTNTGWFISVVLVASAFSARKSSRPQAWSTGIKLARDRIQAGLIDVSEKSSDEVAINVAARGVSQLDIRFHPRWVDSVLNAAVSTGVGGLAAIGVTGFEAIVVGFATDLVLEGASSVGNVARRVAAREIRLENIARLGAGRIRPDWTGDR